MNEEQKTVEGLSELLAKRRSYLFERLEWAQKTNAQATALELALELDIISLAQIGLGSIVETRGGNCSGGCGGCSSPCD